jgi:hypothetical protein
MLRYFICGIWSLTILTGLAACTETQAGATPAATRPAATSRFTDTTNGYSLDHPADWTEYQYPIEHGVAVFELVKDGVDEAADIKVVIGKAHSFDPSLTKFGDQMAKTKTDFGAKVDSDELVKIDGLKARKICYSGSAVGNDGAKKYVDWVACKDGNEIAISFICPEKKYAADLRVAEAVVKSKSFRWTATATITPPR